MQKENIQISKHSHPEIVMILILKTVLPIGLLGGGLWLLTLRIAGWSIIIGLPMVVIGVVFLIYSYDDMVSGKINYHIDSDKGEKIY